ncbi:MAG: type I glutamate--ammonia ligase [Candidatus Tectomicrobia bacterium]|nr:type I glutamate--ammonia ligase [Candidatus Tectomicrobia bacterium]
MTPQEVRKFSEDNGVKIVDLKFIDLPGVWQHFSIPMRDLTEGLFRDGVGFDGSSIRGFQTIQESDMLLFPDPDSAFLDPFTEEPTLSLICNVLDPVTLEKYSRDPRYVAQKAELYLKSTGIADTAYFGPEAEFFIFDDIRFGQGYNHGFYYIDSVAGFWNSGREENPNLGYKPRYKEGYFPVPPMDKFHDIRTEMLLTLESIGVEVETHHHEVATAGQAEIDLRFDTLVVMGDKMCKYKYVIKNVAKRRGKTVTLMPKPLFQDNGSGMHTHQSLWKGGQNVFFQAGNYADLSEEAIHYIGGLIKHAPSLLALCAPTTNSYRRLVPGYEAPINLIYSQRNRSACVRIPMYSKSERAKRIEFRPPDASCNPYLAFAAMLMAGLDGIQNKIIPPDPIDRNLYDLEPEVAAQVESTPGSLEEVLKALEADHEYLLKGDVFTSDLLQTWIGYKRVTEVDAIRLRPHPYEFALYFDI